MAEDSKIKTAAEIINSIEWNFDKEYEDRICALKEEWKNLVGDNLAKFTEPTDLSEKGILFIRCKNSVSANEIFNNKTKINKELKAKAKELNLEFKYIKITYTR